MSFLSRLRLRYLSLRFFSALLTSFKLARTGARRVFLRIYFALRKARIATLLETSKHPVFSKNVEELVYDSRLFRESLAIDAAEFRQTVYEPLEDMVFPDGSENIVDKKLEDSKELMSNKADIRRCQ